ncbi:hypothetical protein G9A89_014853 [Geosiphon pyriformis]|nr:hypothetical protein G9A89_014853 [Geosiphon pyriformis]
MAKIYIIIYSLYGHIKILAEEVKRGIEESGTGSTATIYQVPETLSDEIIKKMHGTKFDLPYITPAKLLEADGYLFGIPTRFGNVPAQIKAFFDACGGHWVTGALQGKFAGIFSSTGSQHGGQETTAYTALTWFVHQGINFAPLGYSTPELQDNTEVIGGSPWGAGTVAGADGSRQPSDKEKIIAQVQGKRFAQTLSTYVKGLTVVENEKRANGAEPYTISTSPLNDSQTTELSATPNFNVKQNDEETYQPTTTTTTRGIEQSTGSRDIESSGGDSSQNGIAICSQGDLDFNMEVKRTIKAPDIHSHANAHRHKSFLPFFPFVLFIISLNVPLFVPMNPVGSSAGISGSSSAGLGSQSGSKMIKAHVESVYLCNPSYKKMKLSGVSSGVVDSSAGLLSVSMLHNDGAGLQRSWGSEIDSEEMSVSKVLDVENLENTVAEETSYVNPNTSETDEIEDNATFRKTRTRTFVLKQPPKAIFFVSMNDNNSKVVLPGAKFAGSNWLLPAISRVLVRCVFGPVKLFALDVELLKVPGKTNSDKLISIKKIFYHIDGFGRTSIPSKFLGIIRSTFTSESSLNKAKLIAVNKNIIVNTVIEFESAEVALALAVGDKQMWVSKDHHQALLYTLLIGMTAHDLVDLLESYGGKMCFIGRNPSLYACDRCAIICFENVASKLAAFGSVLVFKGVSLCWAGLFLACCATCKQYGHTNGKCSISGNSGSCGKRVVTDLNCVYLASIYKKKQALVTRPVSFSGRTWASVVGAPLVCSSHGAGLILGSNKVGKPLPPVVNDLEKHLVNIESSLISLAGQIGELAKKLDLLVLAVPQPSPECQLLVASSSQNQGEDIVIGVGSEEVTSDKTVNTATVEDSFASLHVTKLENILEGLAACGLIWRIATCNIRDMNNLVLIFTETKLKDKTCLWLATKFDGVCVFSSDLNSGYVGAGVAIVMNNSLAKHMCKTSEVSGCLLCIRLLFKNKLLVLILGLYADAFLTVWFSQVAEINSLIMKAVNKSFFVILGGDFNKDSSHKCTSFKKCHDLGLINSLGVGPLTKQPT